MLCEGSPLLFYTPWGPVTPMGMYRGARRLSRKSGEPNGDRSGTLGVCKSYYRSRRLGVVCGSDFLEKIHQMCWFSGCVFRLPIKKSAAFFGIHQISIPGAPGARSRLRILQGPTKSSRAVLTKA